MSYNAIESWNTTTIGVTTMTELDLTAIEELVREMEEDPSMREHLRLARIRLAPKLNPDHGPAYDRMMRGEGPK